MQNEDADTDTQQALTGFCIMGLDGSELTGPIGTECEPWSEWRDLLMRRTLADALANCPAGRVIVEAEAWGKVLDARLGMHAPYGKPVGLWAISGDDIAEARDAAAAYGIEWRGVVCQTPIKGEQAQLAMYRFRREFRRKHRVAGRIDRQRRARGCKVARQPLLSRWTMAIHPDLVPVVAGFIAIAALIFLFLVTGSELNAPATRTTAPYAVQTPAGETSVAGVQTPAPTTQSSVAPAQTPEG